MQASLIWHALSFRDGKYDVLDVDPELEYLDTNFEKQSSGKAGFYEGPTLLNQAGTYFPSDSQALDELKARLERLLP